MNLYEARDFIAENYPGLSYTEAFPKNCIDSITSHVSDGCIPLFSQAKANKVEFTFEDGKKVTIPIKSHLFPVDTKVYMTTYKEYPVKINQELIDNLKLMQRALADGYDTPAMLEANNVLNDLYTKYNRTQEEVDALLAATVIPEEQYLRFKRKNKLV